MSGKLTGKAIEIKCFKHYSLQYHRKGIQFAFLWEVKGLPFSTKERVVLSVKNGTRIKKGKGLDSISSSESKCRGQHIFQKKQDGEDRTLLPNNFTLYKINRETY